MYEGGVDAYDGLRNVRYHGTRFLRIFRILVHNIHVRIDIGSVIKATEPVVPNGQVRVICASCGGAGTIEIGSWDYWAFRFLVGWEDGFFLTEP